MLRPVLRSDELPIGEGGSGGGSRLRDEALADTVSTPTIRAVRVGGAEILLTRLATGEPVAFEAYCPHQKVSLKTASVFDGYLRCPQHYYLYDPRSGRNVLPARESSPAALSRLKPGCLTTYPVEERDGWIRVSERPNPAPREPGACSGTGTRQAAAAAPAVPAAAAQAQEAVEPPRQTVTVVVDTEFALTLPTKVAPGHLWRLHVSGAEVAVLDQVFQSGGDRAYQVRLAACEAGEATVRCVYAQPWSDQGREVRTFTVKIRDV